MKSLSIVTYIGAATLAALLGVAMATTNPSQSAYEEYAVQHLAAYLKHNACPRVPKFVERLLKHTCREEVDINRPQLQQLVSESTERQDFIFFSIYRTDLSFRRISPLLTFLPSYHAETLGAFQKFYVYSSQERKSELAGQPSL